MVKFFQIGYNKTATTAIHAAFIDSGYKTLHSSGAYYRKAGDERFFETERHPQDIIFNNIVAGRDPIAGFEDFDAFVDMESPITNTGVRVENFKLYDRIYAARPDSLFLLNIRDKRAWLRSRALHANGRYLKVTGRKWKMPHEEVLKTWSREYDHHNAAVKEFFAGKDARFMVFDTDTDPAEKLFAFLRPEFEIKEETWQPLRVTKRVSEKRNWDAEIAEDLLDKAMAA